VEEGAIELCVAIAAIEIFVDWNGINVQGHIWTLRKRVGIIGAAKEVLTV
jgi:hypothetical protein